MARKKKVKTDEIDLTIPDFLICPRKGEQKDGEEVISSSTTSKQRSNNKDKVRSTKVNKGSKSKRKVVAKKV